jgi:molecular chaperone GrpE (heat shock protein)
MNNTQEYILQKSVDNLIKMVDKLNKDLETVSKEAEYYQSMYLKYKVMYQDLLFHETGVKDGKVSTGQEDKSQSTIVASSDTEEESKVKVKVNNTDEFCKLMDDIYPQK